MPIWILGSSLFGAQLAAELGLLAGVNVVAAGTDSEARHLFTSVQQQFANLFRGTPYEILADLMAKP